MLQSNQNFFDSFSSANGFCHLKRHRALEHRMGSEKPFSRFSVGFKYVYSHCSKSWLSG